MFALKLMPGEAPRRVLLTGPELRAALRPPLHTERLPGGMAIVFGSAGEANRMIYRRWIYGPAYVVAYDNMIKSMTGDQLAKQTDLWKGVGVL